MLSLDCALAFTQWGPTAMQADKTSLLFCLFDLLEATTGLYAERAAKMIPTGPTVGQGEIAILGRSSLGPNCKVS